MFTPFAFVKSTAAGAASFNPELVANLYYWWDFTDSSNMTFSSGTTIATVNNKATRTSSNETLNAITGAPTFTSAAEGSRFTTADAISNTSVAGTGGNLDTLFSNINSTVIWIGKAVTITNVDQFNDFLWGAAGTEINDAGGTISALTSGAQITKCSTDSAVSATFNRQINYHDYNGSADVYFYRTYNSTSTDFTSDFNMVAWKLDWVGDTYNNTSIAVNTQGFCTLAGTLGNTTNNTFSNRGFKVNARSRDGATYSADQRIQHILIYNGLLSDGDLTTIYNSWEGI